jgi:AraC-like DNA-binding protein
VYSTDIDSDHHFGRHWHDSYGFGFLEHGAQEWWSSRGTVRGYPGDVISTNPGEVHDGRPLGAPTRRWRILYMDVDVMASVTAHHGQHAEIVRPVIADRAVIQALRRLFSRIDRWNVRAGQVDALAIEEALVDSCVPLMARHGSGGSGGSRGSGSVASSNLKVVRDRLADDVSDVPTLDQLAAMTALSRYQVLRHFEKAFGLPPHAWLLRRRAEKARVLIRDGMALATAAAECGFVDQSHLTRVFLRQFGFTPGAWRKAARLQ